MSDALSKTSTTLIRAAKANDQDAWTRLVELYGRRIYRWCRHAGLQPADAGNVVQEVLRSVARKLPDFRHETAQDSFRGWIRRITQNKVNDHFRSEGKKLLRTPGGTDAHRRLLQIPAHEVHEPTWATNSFSKPASAVVIDSERLQLIRSQFADRDWRIFWRVVVDGQVAADVGREFGITANAVRLVKMRLLRKLREQLGVTNLPKTTNSRDGAR